MILFVFGWFLVTTGALVMDAEGARAFASFMLIGLGGYVLGRASR